MTVPSVLIIEDDDALQHMYETAFKELDIGYASALSFLMFVVILLVTLIQFRVLNRQVAY